MKLTITALIVILFLPEIAVTEVFQHRFESGEKYRIVTEVREKVLLNGKYSHSAEFLNKIAVEILSVKNSAAEISAQFYISERSYTTAGVFQLSEDFISTFERDSRGHDTVADHVFAPFVRDIPLFPDRELQSGETWSAPGLEVHDLRKPYGVEKPYKIPIIVNYTYVGNTKSNERTLARLKIEYSFLHTVKGIKSTHPLYNPVKISGSVSQEFLWDLKNGKPDSYDEAFDIIYFFSSGDYVEFIGTSRGEVYAAPLLDKKEMVEEIKETMKEQDVQGVQVQEDSKGVKLTLENIQFDPDSDQLLSGEKAKLEKISQILKKYPERDILVIGHTARVGTEESCQELSESRAGAVGNFLLQHDTRKENQMIISGQGSKNPVADNSTEEGRIKNRRVEIIVLEN